MTKPTHWRNHTREMADRFWRKQKLVIVTGFDGVLAPPVPDPRKTHVTSAAVDALALLTTMKPSLHVAIISSRPLRHLTALLPTQLQPELIVGGNHGSAVGRAALIDPGWEVAPVESHLQDLLGQLLALSQSLPGVSVEDHGQSRRLSFEYARSDRLPELFAALKRMRLPPFIREFRFGSEIEFHLAAVWNKGLALRHLIDHLQVPASAVVFIGCDATDEHAFLAIRDFGITLRVGAAAETSAARWHTHDLADAVKFMRTLAFFCADHSDVVPFGVEPFACPTGTRRRSFIRRTRYSDPRCPA